MRSIALLRTTNRVAPEDVLIVRAEGDLVACDFYVDGIELGEEVAGGYRLGRILNIDHHAPTPRMRRRISSTNLALEMIEVGGVPLGEDAVVVVNHIDCDSVLSSGILSGRLPPDPRFGEAAIAADHTGEENEIADLLQGIDAEITRRTGSPRRTLRDYEYSIENLQLLWTAGQERLDDLAKGALKARLQKRREAEAIVSRGGFQKAGPLHFAVVDEPIDGEFFPALLPDAAVIMLANRLSEDPPRWRVKLRLGEAAPPGLALSDLGIPDFDPNYGGRWNAGSNQRLDPDTGLRGTDLSPDDYARRLAERLSEHFQRTNDR
jgi:hypothetical protein